MMQPVERKLTSLEYAPGAAIRRRRVIRRAIFAILLIVATAASIRWGPPVWRRARLLHHQRQCLAYNASPDRVIFDSHLEAAEELLTHAGGPDGFIPIPTGYPDAARAAPQCLIELEKDVGATIRPCPGEPAFMHERISRSGIRRLVIVHPACLYTDNFNAVIDPATWFKPATSVWVQDSILKPGETPFLAALPGIRVFAGQPDRTDPTHFTIAYDVSGEKGIVDGYLKDNGSVDLVHRHGPATRRAVRDDIFTNPPGFKIKTNPLLHRPAGDLIDDSPAPKP
jgi:hypothetical protein